MKKSQNIFFSMSFSSMLYPVLGSVFLLKAITLNAIQDALGSNAAERLETREMYYVFAMPHDLKDIDNPCDQLKFLVKGYNPLPLVDWLNVSNLPSFFEPTVRSLLKRDEYYNAIDALGKYDLGVQPYGFFSSYKLDKDSFKLSTFGVNIDGGIELFNRWVIGGGLGYWHSNLDWGKHFNKDSADSFHDKPSTLHSKNTVNSFYGGPYAGYIFDQAYVGLTLLGVYNMYNIDHLLGEMKGKKHSHHGWDIAARLEGGYDFEWSRYTGRNFFIQPNGILEYLWVFQNKIEEEKIFDKEDKLEAVVDSRTYHFFRSRLGVTFKKEFHHAERGILIPSISLAWVLMQPLSQSKIGVTCGDGDEESFKSKSYPSSNQAYLGVKVAAISKRGMMLSLGGDFYFAKAYPVYGGNLRFEWNW